MKDMTAKGEALNDSMLSQQLTWWCLDLAIWHHVPVQREDKTFRPY